MSLDGEDSLLFGIQSADLNHCDDSGNGGDGDSSGAWLMKCYWSSQATWTLLLPSPLLCLLWRRGKLNIDEEMPCPAPCSIYFHHHLNPCTLKGYQSRHVTELDLKRIYES